MTDVIVSLITVIFCITTATGAGTCGKPFEIKAHNLNKRLVGHTVIEISVRDHHDCARECMSLKICNSIDYHIKEKTCKLNDVDSLSVDKSEFELKSGAVFSDITEWPNAMVNKCGQRPCTIKQKCVSDGEKFTCLDIGPTFSDCLEVRQQRPSAASGIYQVKIFESGQMIKVYCDMDTEGGGWTAFQNRFDGSVDFYRTFTEYETGFGDLEGEFWLGLQYMQDMLKQGNSELRIDLVGADGSASYVKNKEFWLSDGNDYRLQIGKISGVGEHAIGNSVRNFDGHAFSTKDRDMDVDLDINCAEAFHGAWWYNDCGNVNLNGIYEVPGTKSSVFSGNGGMIYRVFDGYKSLSQAKMMFRRE